MKTTMKKLPTAAAAAAICVLGLLSTVPVATATTVSECRQMIADLSLATQGTEFFGRSAVRDEAALLAKLGEATTKLDQAKFPDAIQKLTDYRNKVLALAAQGKINTDSTKGTTAQDLVDGVDAAMKCIHDLCGC
jgi:hypothetical protein